jgi:hypothetical protein
MASKHAEILALQPKQTPFKYFLGEGLYVHVFPNGRKYWRLKYYLNGKQGVFSIGVFPRVSVAEAIMAKTLARSQLRKGINPTGIKHDEAKERKKAVSKKLFRYELSIEGRLTIETNIKLVTLTPSQTDALRSFLLAANSNEGKHEEC